MQLNALNKDNDIELYLCITYILQTVLQRKPIMLKYSFQNIKK
jgi:hypothetical protein